MTDLSGIAGSEAEGVPGSGGSDGVRSRGDGSEAPALCGEVEFAARTLLAEEPDLITIANYLPIFYYLIFS